MPNPVSLLGLPPVNHCTEIIWHCFVLKREGTTLSRALIEGSVESLALAQTLSRLHSSGASCPVLSARSLPEAPEATKDLLCWPLLTLASSHSLHWRPQKLAIILTPQVRTHLQTTDVSILTKVVLFIFKDNWVSGWITIHVIFRRKSFQNIHSSHSKNLKHLTCVQASTHVSLFRMN